MARDFLASFACFEFTLKRGAFLAGNVGAGAEPNWNEFAGALGPDLLVSIRIAPEAGSIFNEPPKKALACVPERETLRMIKLFWIYAHLQGDIFAQNNCPQRKQPA